MAKTETTRTSSRQSRSLAKAQEQKRRQRLTAVIIGSVMIAVIAVITLILLNNDSPSTSELPDIVAATAPDASIARDGMTLGSPDAPIKLIEYGDYQCPFCGQFNQVAMPPLLADYIATGKVQLTFVPFSFLGDESNRATEAALCAADQGLFWEMHEGIYGNQSGENKGAFSSERLRIIAINAGLDMSVYDDCMKTGAHEDQIKTLNAQATAAGVKSTPSFTINGGAPFAFRSWTDFKAQLDEELAQ